MSKLIHLETKRRLELKNHALSRRIAGLFNELSKNSDLHKTFIESPIEVIGQEVLGQSYTQEQASAVNKFIFSVLANKSLQKWGEEYAKDHVGKKVPAETRFADLAKALMKYGDPSLMAGLMEAAAAGATIPGLAREDSALIVKADSVAIGNWFVYKVSGNVFGDDNIVLPPELVQLIAGQLVEQAQMLQAGGEI